MGILDNILSADAVNVFCDGNAFAEPITYTPFVNGIAQTAVSINAVIDRSDVIVQIGESQQGRVKQLHLWIPKSATGGVPTVNRSDILTAPWRVGDAPSKFRVTKIENQDAGMWELIAEMSIN